MRAPALERRLAGEGLTLGHFPQSFEYVSLGGCAATRSAGQASSGYGAIERMIMGLRMSAPAGERAVLRERRGLNKRCELGERARRPELSEVGALHDGQLRVGARVR